MMFEGMEPVEFEHDGTHLRGYVAHPDASGPVPAVLVMHSALGIGHAVNEPVARKLADAGLPGRLHGHVRRSSRRRVGRGSRSRVRPEPGRSRSATRSNRRVVRRGRPPNDVDDARVAAVGFCYGGTTVLELARSGANLAAAVSYHGILTTHAPAEPGTIPGHVVAYCGAGDPYAPLADVDNLRDEMQRAGVKYQITIFGTAAHGFTDPDAARLQLDGVSYDELAHDLSWTGTLVLLQHLFRR